MGAVGHFFSRLSFLSSFSLLGDGPIQTEILSERAVKTKTTNQPTKKVPIHEVPCIAMENADDMSD